MTTYVSELDVSLTAAEERDLKQRGFNIIDGNLNKGAGGYDIRLWYKNGPSAITKVQVSFNYEMSVGLTKAGYTKIEKDLNAGAGGSYLYIWFLKGSGEFDTPIVDISVSTDAANEAEKFASGWQRVACDLNREAEGNWIHVWLKREEQTYICDVDATDSYGSDIGLFQKGYIRVDEDTNRGAGGAYVFIWYRQTTDPEKALKDLQVSITDSQYQEYQKQDYQRVVVDLNQGTGGNQVFLWYKKRSNPIKAIALLLNQDVVKEYQEAGINVILRNLNVGNKGIVEHLCFYQ
ncbi:Chromatin assembly factor 1 subunit FAS2 [Dissostichus eleginoides]|uniref:Chromatin assembly factor 1 subunit FAS2 n=1 Tax=Dissostichus eleginoides TaxID=100907 RepID=A0AAD9EY23_DISEL|nr:Chromatin assembly factor 1 subunit FAS2 [Dissostichus eleginoides]